jgi:lipopolysaccharide/colanic/teichoic acid biosynthesis glycosyltransferase
MRVTRRARRRHSMPNTPPGAPPDASQPLAARMRRAYVTHALAGWLPQRRHWRLKRALDLAVLLPLLVGALPLSLVIALSVWVRFHQRAIITRHCATRGGVVFNLRQFRSFRSAGSAANTPPASDDPGLPDAWLSASRLARLPALWSVARGEMSLVGPAPCAIAQVAERPVGELARLYVVPGVARLRPVGRLRRLAASQAEADLRYVTHGSLWMDCEQLAAAIFTPSHQFPSRASSAEALDTSDSSHSSHQEGKAAL